MTHCTRRHLLAGGTAALALGGRDAGAAEDPPFKLGTVTYNVPRDWDLDTLLRILPQAGIAAVEFRTTHRHGVEPSLTAMQRADVRRRCVDAGLVIWGLGTVCEFHSPDAETVRRNVETCSEFVKLARDIGAKGVKVRPNGLPPEVPVEKTLEQISAALRRCGDIGRDHGVEIWVEVHGSGTQEPPHMRRILEHCGHRSVGVNWNSNAADVKDGSVKEAFELLRPFLMSCHINNLDSAYPYAELFRLLRQADYRRYTLCEVGTAVPPEQGLEWFRRYRARWLELAGG
jgi:sugar phosphate isomerase/epimerase